MSNIDYCERQFRHIAFSFTWDLFPAMYLFIMRNPIACEIAEGNWEIKIRIEEEIESEMQRMPALAIIKP